MSNPINRPLNIPGKRKRLTKRMIETAMENTKSNMAAAKWLSVSYNTYKKWAKYYGLFDKHLNQAGVGIKKGWATYRIPLENMRLLCPNCYLSNNGILHNSKVFCK
jgi:hypothetical protein